jgi:hypothetical protein
MPGSLLTPFNVVSSDRVAEEIRQQKEQGADFIKVGLVSPDVFFAAIAEGNIGPSDRWCSGGAAEEKVSQGRDSVRMPQV